jgi:ABC-2 type transport system permease protein
MNVLWMALWGIGWVVVRQRRVGILKRFKASPLTPAEYLIAQLLSRLLVLIVTAVIIFAGSHLIYPFHTEGSYLTLFIVYIIGCLSISSLGFIIAARFTSEEFSNGMMNLITYPMMFLSEIWFSLEGSPEWVLKLAKFMPLWHLTDSMRRIMNEGATMMDVMPSITVMSAITIVFTIIGARLFKWT